MVELLVFIMSVVISVFVGTFVVMRDPRKPINQIYGALTFSFIVLGVANYMSLVDSENALFYIRLTVCATALCMGALFLLVATLRKNAKCVLQVPLNWGVIISSVGVAVLSMTPFVFSGTKSYGAQIGPVAEWGFALFVLHFFILITMSYRIILTGVKGAKGRTRQQYATVLAGLTPILCLAPLTGVVLPILFQIPDLIFLTPAYVTFFVTMIAYAMIRHHLFDIRFAAVRSAVYICVIVTLSAAYYLFVYLLSTVFSFNGDQAFTNVNPLVILIALCLGLLFTPLKHFFDHLTNQIFYRGVYDSDIFFSQLNRILTSTSDLHQLLATSSRKIADTLRAEQVAFFVTSDANRIRSAGTSNYFKLPKRDIESLNEYVQWFSDMPIQEELLDGENRGIQRIMKSGKYSIIVPLVQYDTIVGYLCIGHHRTNHYTGRDMVTIETISDSLVIAIQNALALQQVKDLNENLQQRIDDATSELRRSNAQLQRLDEAKDEFVSMASHQLRTPLTSVKGYLDMVLQGDAGEINDMQRHLLGEAFSSSERMVHLINDFLNVSRLQTGKFIVEKMPTDIVKLVEQEVESLEVSATQRQLKFDLKIGKNIPQLAVDESKLRQVVMNFLDNSLYYSRADTKILVQLINKDDRLEFTVKDTGIGVPEKEQGHLFTKFYRASNARKQRPDGTGVGLFLAKKVITAHGGQVIFSSSEGKGSTFGFSLPIAKLKVAESKKASLSK